MGKVQLRRGVAPEVLGRVKRYKWAKTPEEKVEEMHQHGWYRKQEMIDKRICYELGRLVMLTGSKATCEMWGKMATITDIISRYSVMVHGPTTGVERQAWSTRNMFLTDIVTPGVEPCMKGAKLKEMLRLFDTMGKWSKKPQALELAKHDQHKGRSDFENFKHCLQERTGNYDKNSVHEQGPRIPVLAAELHDNRIEYLVPGVFAVAFSLLGLQKFSRLQKSRGESRNPLVHT